MSRKIIFFAIFLLSLLISLSSQNCQIQTNNCVKCNPLSNLCVVCDKIAYKPDQKGGCEPIHLCAIGENYCNKCNNNGDVCLQCELGFFADENGGCSNTDNCIVSENGKCLQCKDDFYLIERCDISFCKYKFSDDFKNCAEIDLSNGKCSSCEENYYLGYDSKCSNTDLCIKSTFGICTLCFFGTFLDKTDNLCKAGGSKFKYCKMSLDGKTCSECNVGYFLSEDSFCTKSQNCAKINTINNLCIECLEGFFLTEFGNICIKEEHCYQADYDLGFCGMCEDSFFLEEETKKCVSNQVDLKFKFCSKVSSGICINCEFGYVFGNDNKCVSSLNCLESESGICIKCEEGYHLGLDNKCTNIEKCIYSNSLGECTECDNNYYFDRNKKQCFPAINQYKNCKISNLENNYCGKCKNDFYLSSPDKMCYNNTKEGPFYKCAFSEDGTKCSICVDYYFLGFKDLKCSKIEGCAISENKNKCIECEEYLCLDTKKQICVQNLCEPENEEEKIYFNCKKTNEQGTGCEICNDNRELVNEICVNKVECEEEKNGECIKCNEKSYNNKNMCLNSVYGCVETFVSNCLRCDNIHNFDECTVCVDGYELDEDGDCVAKVEF